MSRSLPEYPDDVAGFAGILRKYLGLSQRKVAAKFHLNHSTIARYEGEGIDPPVGYLACLVRLVLEKHQSTTKQHIVTNQQFLLREINKAIEHNYPNEPRLQSWDELGTVADEYLARQQNRDNAVDNTSLETQPAFNMMLGQSVVIKVVEAINDYTQQKSVARNRRNREIMLKKVQIDWVKGVLDASLHGARLLQLSYEDSPEMVDHPWDTVVKRPNHKDEILPKSTDILNVYDEMGGSFLILGAPGSGKTTTLLELTRELIKRAMQNDTYCIPVVFNLSTWGVKRGDIRDWLVNELYTKYQVPTPVASEWIDNNELILLLDGLDEVKREFQNECVEKINKFRHNHMVNMIITSRTDDYKRLTSRLILAGAIIQKPLSLLQIDEYLKSLGHRFQNVREEIKKDEILLELAQSPLVLNIIAVTYQKKRITDFHASTLKERRDQLFEAYVNIMFEHRKIKEKYSRQQIIDRLVWLAKYMQRNAITIFRIEQLQPDALSGIKERKLFFVSTNIILWLLVLPFFGSSCGVMTFFLSHSLIHGIINSVLFGVTGGLGLWLATRGFFSLQYRFFLGILTGLSMTSLVWIFIHNIFLCLLVFLFTSSAITFLFRRINLNVTDQLSRIEINNFEWSLRAGIYGFYKRMPLAACRREKLYPSKAANNQILLM